MRDINRRRRTTLLKEDSVRPEKHTHTHQLGCPISRFWGNEPELTGQEAVQLHQQLEVDIVTLRRLAVSVADVVSVKIDT